MVIFMDSFGKTEGCNSCNMGLASKYHDLGWLKNSSTPNGDDLGMVYSILQFWPLKLGKMMAFSDDPK